MRKFALITLLSVLIISGCNVVSNKTVRGNGKIASVNRSINNASRIKVLGSMDVYLSEGPTSVRVEGDENVLRYIVTEIDNNWLEIRTEDDVNLVTENNIKVYITTPTIRDISVAGSGNVKSDSKLVSNSDLGLRVSGSGDVTMMINTPKVDAKIAGSGNINISGETRDVEIDIAGAGNFKGRNLKAENAKIKIAGSGDVEVFADVVLDAKIVGSGNIAYRGNARVDQKIVGSGDIRRIE